MRVTSGLIDFTLKKAADVVADAEHAFKQGLDANVEDAKIIEERDAEKKGKERGREVKPLSPARSICG